MSSSSPKRKPGPDAAPPGAADRASAGHAAAGRAAAGRAAREQSAQELIKKYSLGTGAVGFVPLPLVDLVALSALQRKMLKALCELYGVEYSDHRLKLLIGALLSDAASVWVAGQAGTLFGSLVKSVPVVGSLAGAALMPASTSASTYALGRVFARHFEAGGTLDDFDPKEMRGDYERQIAEAQAPAASVEADRDGHKG